MQPAESLVARQGAVFEQRGSGLARAVADARGIDHQREGVAGAQRLVAQVGVVHGQAANALYHGIGDHCTIGIQHAQRCR
ncbi:hypothetical protein N5938_18945 [Pseudomonas aeruginosa]|uniref:hypothetical protein n=1 Tax=Pseudomonas aeruginosa TaxID=287 RepID=UPI0021F1E724|nr:hypothetical protein [Pseudomonas aeruginosa]UYM58709.1 hypothetical protein N5938_18945 [Pseudomonas aeruginosa]